MGRERKFLEQTLEKSHVEQKWPDPTTPIPSSHHIHAQLLAGGCLGSVMASDWVQTEADPKGSVAGGCELPAFFTGEQVPSWRGIQVTYLHVIHIPITPNWKFSVYFPVFLGRL